MVEQPVGPQLHNVEAIQPIVSYRDNILTKVDVAWGSNVGDQGYADPYEVAARLYDALYRPDAAVEGMDSRAQAKDPEIVERELPSQKLRPDTKKVLTTPLELAGQLQDSAEFVRVVAGAILHGADVANAVLPGAREQIKELIENGDRAAAWSAGYPEHQWRKLGKTGMYAEVMEGVEPPVEISLVHGEPITVETAIATDKTVEETIARVREIAGDDQKVVADDRVRNLRKFLEAMPETKAAIWVQYGAHAQKEMDKLANGENPQLAVEIESGIIIPISNINQLASKVVELRKVGRLTAEQAVLFFDYDDTISNNALRRDMELAAAVDAIFENGWA